MTSLECQLSSTSTQHGVDLAEISLLTLRNSQREYEGRVKVLKVDVDKNEQLAMAARIQSIPTLFFIDKEGNIERHVGGLPFGKLAEKADELLK